MASMSDTMFPPRKAAVGSGTVPPQVPVPVGVVSAGVRSVSLSAVTGMPSGMSAASAGCFDMCAARYDVSDSSPLVGDSALLTIFLSSGFLLWREGRFS
jgi:hypothetical protein